MPPGSYLIRGSCENTEAGCDTQGGTFKCTSVCERVRVHMHACYCVCLDTHARTHARLCSARVLACVRAHVWKRLRAFMRHGARIKFNVQPAALSPQHDSMKDGGNRAATKREKKSPRRRGMRHRHEPPGVVTTHVRHAPVLCVRHGRIRPGGSLSCRAPMCGECCVGWCKRTRWAWPILQDCPWADAWLERRYPTPCRIRQGMGSGHS